MRFLAVLVVVAGCGGGTEPGPRAPGANCHLVAETLTTIELGNYAPREERVAREKALKAQCEREHLTKAEGACITTATSKDDIAWCPKPLIVPSRLGEGGDESAGSGSSPPLVGICETYVRTLERFARCSKLPPETARSLRQQISQLRAMYTQYATSAPDTMVQSCQMANDATTKALIQTGC